jgi:hypothetical protein
MTIANLAPSAAHGERALNVDGEGLTGRALSAPKKTSESLPRLSAATRYVNMTGP